jgi:hypothetical protein
MLLQFKVEILGSNMVTGRLNVQVFAPNVRLKIARPESAGVPLITNSTDPFPLASFPGCKLRFNPETPDDGKLRPKK